MLFPSFAHVDSGEDSIGHLSDFPFRVSSQLKMGIFEIGISKIPILVYSRRRHKIRPSTEVPAFNLFGCPFVSVDTFDSIICSCCLE